MIVRSRKGNVPAEFSSFVGRRTEVSEVRRLMGAARLVTLTGVGGVGKTRLALRVAAALDRSYADGVWLVELAGLQDPGLLTAAVSDALGVSDRSTRDAVDVLTGFLAQRELLLVVDNCEHLLPAAASLVARLLSAAPGLRVLATSREPLQVPGERLYAVAPLPVPDPVDTEVWGDAPGTAERGAAAAPPGPDDAAGAQLRYPAMALFADRAAAVWPDFALGGETVAEVARICRRLDGIPLAIELAAARLRALSVGQLAERLDDRFAVLAVGNRAALPRHQTMRAAVDWSFELCGTPERLLWKRASVFAGSFTAEAASQVCAGGGLAAEDVPGALNGLVDKSVLLAEENGDTRRYRLLDTIAHYGLERLRDPHRAHSGPSETALRRRHRDYYLDLAERFHADWFGPRQVTWSRRMLAELPNLREALSFCLSDVAEVRAGVQLAGALYYMWYACGGTREGRYWLDRLLAADPTPSPQRIAALTTNARLQLIQGAPAAAAKTAAQAVDLIKRYDHPELMPDALRTVGLGHLYTGTQGAMELLEEATVAAAELGTTHPALAFALFALSIGALVRGDPRRAVRLLADSRAICQAHGDRWWQGITLSAAVTPAMRLGDLDQALEYGRESLRVRRGLRDIHGLASTVEFLAWIASATGEHRRAARLLGAADWQWEAAGGSPFAAGVWLDEHDARASATRRALGDRAYEAEFAYGRGLNLDQAVAYALAEEPPDPPAAEPGEARLTRRQREIARLVAQGLSNREIANRLVISQRTAESHVQNILTALGLTNRVQIATWYATQGFPDEDTAT